MSFIHYTFQPPGVVGSMSPSFQVYKGSLCEAEELTQIEELESELRRTLNSDIMIISGM